MSLSRFFSDITPFILMPGFAFFVCLFDLGSGFEILVAFSDGGLEGFLGSKVVFLCLFFTISLGLCVLLIKDH